MKALTTSLHYSLAVLGLTLAVLVPAAVPVHAGDEGPMPVGTISDAIRLLKVAPEDRTGYQRTAFKHWVDADKDGFDTRSEVLIEESAEPPVIDASGKVAGGRWVSYYEGQVFTEPRGLDIDHVVPLAESWDSGSSAWSADERREYANDLTDPRALVAVSAKENRAKGDKDPAQWMPTDTGVHCRYTAEWIAVKLRWGLTVDETEAEALRAQSEACPAEQVEVWVNGPRTQGAG